VLTTVTGVQYLVAARRAGPAVEPPGMIDAP
jgi:hypothetical protein